MKKLTFITTAVILILSLLTSCGDSFLLSPENDKQNTISIISLTQGGVINQGETLSFKVISTDEEAKPEKLEISLFNAAGERVGRLENTTFALNEPLSLDLFESLPPGQYSLDFILSGKDRILNENRITFFYIAGIYSIGGIESFPPVIFPGATVLLAATVAIPPDSDPFIRWTVDNKVIAKGPLSKAMNKILWSVPEEEGVYTVKTELFPASPVNADDFPFNSGIFMDVELYISESSRPARRSLSPENSYYALYHFDGNLADSASGRYSRENALKRAEAKVIGEPELITVDEGFGYYLDQYSGFRIDDCIFPVFEGELKPFTLSMGLEMDPAQKDKNIFLFKSSDNLFSLFIYSNEDSTLYAKLKSGSREFIIPSNINTYSIAHRFLVSLSVFPKNDSLLVYWFLDGIQTNASVYGTINTKFSHDGETVIGGEKGFSGVIDELGVFFLDKKGRYTIDPGLYENAIRQMYGDRMLYAEGFDGFYAPDFLGIKSADRMENGRLALSGSINTDILSPGLNENGVTVVIDFDSPVPADNIITLTWEDDTVPFLTVSTAGTVEIPGNRKVPVLKKIDKSFYMKIHKTGNMVSFPEEELKGIKIPEPKDINKGFRLEIVNKAQTPIYINSITALKEMEE